MKTFLPKQADIKQNATWYVIDAKGMTLGKVAEKAARILTGKDRADFTPHMDLGDGVIVINAAWVELTGAKLTDKLYRRHSGYRGNMKEINAGDMLEKDPARMVHLAVSGMMPKNKLTDDRMLRLKVYAGEEHPHTAQQPVAVSF